MDILEKTGLLKNRLIEIYKRDHPPETDGYLKVLEKINSVLKTEDPEIRPYNAAGLPGGLLLLKHDIPTVIIPDIHARRDFFLNLMHHENSGHTILENMALDLLQVVCVGDGVHAERRAAKRWAEALKEYEDGYEKHENIDEEMKESLGVMEMIMEVKSTIPSNFHYLKGNHDNISNEEGEGNHPFLKFANEGAMVAEYVDKFYGEELLTAYYNFEKNLPLFVVGKNFLISHAEPEMFFEREDIIEYRDHPEVVEGLTWTANDAALPGSVKQMIENYIEESEQENSFYFGGHRPVSGLYNPRADGSYIQIHNPNKFIMAVIDPDREINLEDDVVEIKDRMDEILKN